MRAGTLLQRSADVRVRRLSISLPDYNGGPKFPGPLFYQVPAQQGLATTSPVHEVLSASKSLIFRSSTTFFWVDDA